jgi:hypothetical protein
MLQRAAILLNQQQEDLSIGVVGYSRETRVDSGLQNESQVVVFLMTFVVVFFMGHERFQCDVDHYLSFSRDRSCT